MLYQLSRQSGDVSSVEVDKTQLRCVTTDPRRKTGVYHLEGTQPAEGEFGMEVVVGTAAGKLELEVRYSARTLSVASSCEVLMVSYLPSFVLGSIAAGAEVPQDS